MTAAPLAMTAWLVMTLFHRVVFRIPAFDRVLHAAQMLAHAIDAQGLITRLERLEDFQMLAVVALTRSEDPEDEPLLLGEEVGQNVEELGEYGVSRRPRDLAVKAHVHFVEHTVVREILTRCGEQAAHLDEILERR